MLPRQLEPDSRLVHLKARDVVELSIGVQDSEKKQLLKPLRM